MQVAEYTVFFDNYASLNVTELHHRVFQQRDTEKKLQLFLIGLM